MNIECPRCWMENAYYTGVSFECPDCDYEWEMEDEEVYDHELETEARVTNSRYR